MFKRIVTILLAVLMLAGTLSLFSCKKKTPDAPGGDSVPSDSTSDSQTEDTGAEFRFDVEESLDYGGKEIVVLTWKEDEFGVFDLTNKDIVNQALVSRDNYVKNYLNIKLKLIQKDGAWSQAQTFAQDAINSISNGQQAYDLVCAYSMVPSIMTYYGVLHDLGGSTFKDGSKNYVDYTKTWWPQFMIENLKVNEKIYSITGDASKELLYNMMIVMFDEDALKAKTIDTDALYTAVDEGTWTLQHFMNLTKDLSVENGSNKWDKDDFYAISSNDTTAFSGFYFGTGNRLVENRENRLEISDTITKDIAIDVFETIYDAVNVHHTIRYCDGDQRGVTLIDKKQALFELGTVSTLGSIMTKDATRKIGMLPFPTYEGGNSSYRTLIANGHSHFCIPSDVKDASMSSAVLETFGYGSYQSVTPIVYENVMKVRFSKDHNSSRMFDLIRSSSVSDPGILNYFNFTANDCPDPLSMFRNAVHSTDNSWVSNFENRYQAGMERTLDILNNFYLGFN